MAKYKRTNITAKVGMNFVRTVVEGAGALFHKIDQENDLGIDALIEPTRDERPLGKQLAIQVKSGQSYYNEATEECRIPIESHREYWLTHVLPVIGIVFVPSLNRAHWVDLKRSLKERPNASEIRFLASEANRLDAESVRSVFLPTILREVPDISLPRALALLQSSKGDEAFLGILVLFRRYPNERDAWRELIGYFVSRPPDEIPLLLIYYLAHIPWHDDIGYTGEAIQEKTREFAGDLIRRFGRSEVVKLLEFIDDDGISRGSVGQSVEALVSYLPSIDSTLESIVTDSTLRMEIREFAAMIIAMHWGRASQPLLRRLAIEGSRYSGDLATFFDENEEVYPYS